LAKHHVRYSDRRSTASSARHDRDHAPGGLSFDLLLELVRAAPNLLTYDELMQRVWPGLVVSYETITQRVKLVGDALGDDGARAPLHQGHRRPRLFGHRPRRGAAAGRAIVVVRHADDSELPKLVGSAAFAESRSAERRSRKRSRNQMAASS
jgi:hypothetical protein